MASRKYESADRTTRCLQSSCRHFLIIYNYAVRKTRTALKTTTARWFRRILLHLFDEWFKSLNDNFHNQKKRCAQAETWALPKFLFVCAIITNLRLKSPCVDRIFKGYLLHNKQPLKIELSNSFATSPSNPSALTHKLTKIRKKCKAILYFALWHLWIGDYFGDLTGENEIIFPSQIVWENFSPLLILVDLSRDLSLQCGERASNTLILNSEVSQRLKALTLLWRILELRKWSRAIPSLRRRHCKL